MCKMCIQITDNHEKILDLVGDTTYMTFIGLNSLRKKLNILNKDKLKGGRKIQTGMIHHNQEDLNMMAVMEWTENFA